jgi:hypothetical protein
VGGTARVEAPGAVRATESPAIATAGLGLHRRPGIYLATFGDEGVLFDLPSNRYVALGAVSTRLWRALEDGAGDEIDEHRLALALAIGDLAPEIEAARELVRAQLAQWHAADLLVEVRSDGGRDLPMPRREPGARGALDASRLAPGRPTRRTAIAVGRAMLWVRWNLRRRPLPWLLARLQRIPVDGDAAPGATDAVVALTAWLHGVLRRAVHAGTDDCLPASLALSCALRRQGVDARVCFGVQKFPFAAHAWVEANGRILNDSAEHVARFRAIASF